MKIIIFLTLLFFISQMVGIGLILKDANISRDETGIINVTHSDTVIGPRPEIYDFSAVLYLLTGIVIGTLLIMGIIKFRVFNVWKIFYFFAVFISISVVLGIFLPELYAFGIAFILALLKILRRNIVVHNFTEILVYAGIMLIFVPLFSIIWIIVVLLIISAYDFYAVFKSKHMVTMAEFQKDQKLFAGLSIPYTSRKMGKKTGKIKTRTLAILGGGDIAFPMLFTGVTLDKLLYTLPKASALYNILPLPIIVSASLFVLFMKGKQGKYYPAMPVLTAGCLLGLAVVFLLQYLF